MNRATWVGVVALACGLGAAPTTRPASNPSADTAALDAPALRGMVQALRQHLAEQETTIKLLRERIATLEAAKPATQAARSAATAPGANRAAGTYTSARGSIILNPDGTFEGVEGGRSEARGTYQLSDEGDLTLMLQSPEQRTITGAKMHEGYLVDPRGDRWEKK